MSSRREQKVGREGIKEVSTFTSTNWRYGRGHDVPAIVGFLVVLLRWPIIRDPANSAFARARPDNFGKPAVLEPLTKRWVPFLLRVNG